MAIKDCLRKMKRAGVRITPEQEDALDLAKGQGLTDDQAVRRVILMAHQNVIDIALRAREEGATIAPEPSPVSELAKFQTKALESLQDEVEPMKARIAEISAELNDLHGNDELLDTAIRKVVLERMPNIGEGTMFEMENLTEKEREMVIGQLLMDLRYRRALKEGILSVQGSTIDEVLESWHAEKAKGKALGAEMNELVDKVRTAEARIDTIFSGKQQTFYQTGSRGSITFDDMNRALIRISQSKNLSTFLHESAHLYLEMVGDLAEIPGVDLKLIDDYAMILKFLGVNDRTEIETRHHEMFARSFEAYLREGKAPTAEMQPVFSAYSGWLRIIYPMIRKLLRPHEQLTDEIRSVFDRMIASEEAIAASEDMMGYAQLFATAEEMGVSQEVFDVYKRDIKEDHDAEVDKLTTKSLKATTWAQQQWWKEELKKVAAGVREEAHGMKIYQALAMLQKGKNPDGSEPKWQPIKLDRDDLINRYGKDFLKRLPGRGRYGVYAAKNGTDADVVAGIFGYESGDALVKALIDAPKMEVWIKDRSEQIMQENHPDPLNDPGLAEVAIRAVHSNNRSRILGADLRSLRKKQAEDKPIVKATKDAAKRQDKEAMEANKGQLPKRENLAQLKAAAAAAIGRKRIRDIKPRSYLLAERKAGRLAFQAMERKDYAEAYKQKLAQIMNHEAYRAAIRAKDQTIRDQKYLKTFDKPAKQKRMGKAGYLEKILAVLEGIDLRKISLSQIDREALEKQLVDSITDGDIVTTPEVLALLQNPGGKNWKDFTVDEFAGIRDVVKQLEHQARLDLKAIIHGEEIVIQEAVDEVAGSIVANHDQVPTLLTEERGTKRLKRSVREAASHWLRSSSIARILDKSGFGAVTRRVIVPIRRAYSEKLIPSQHKAALDVAEIYKKFYTNKELGKLNKNLPEKTMGQDFSKADILALALNWGTDGNRAAVLGGVLQDAQGNKSSPYTQEGVAEALSKLDARDWEFVQALWDYQDSYWAQLSETEKRRRGVSPKKVEALPFEILTSDGQTVNVRGGYHHLRYQSDGKRMSEQEFQDYYNKMGKSGYLSASTRAGATFERVANHGKVVRLSLDTVDHNLREILRDMALGDEVVFANRILQSKEVLNAAKNTNNIELLNELKLWLSDAAVGELPAQTSIEKALSYLRVGFTKSKLAFNIYVTLLQLTGTFQSIAVIGSQAFAVGFGKFVTNPVANYKMVMEKSHFMHARYGDMQAFDKDVADTKAFLQSYFGSVPTQGAVAWDKMAHLYFWPIAKMQSLVDVTTWMGSYEKAMNDPSISGDAEAILYADTQVEAAQTSGLFSDRSGLERGTLGTRTRQGQFVRLWTVLISYMLAKGNIAYEKGTMTNFKSPTEVGAFAVDMVLLFAIEGMASALLYGDWPGDEDDEESAAAWAGKATLESVVAGIPMVREFTSVKYASGNTPIGSTITDSFKMVEQGMQFEFDEAAVKQTVKVAGTLFHLPSSQVNRIVEAAFKEEDTAWYEWFLGVREDK